MQKDGNNRFIDGSGLGVDGRSVCQHNADFWKKVQSLEEACKPSMATWTGFWVFVGLLNAIALVFQLLVFWRKL